MIKGERVAERFKLESGIHRVQRVPPTESNGRRHTSTIGVSIFSVDENVISSYNPNEFKIECFCGGGPGGQNRNKNATNVRVTHIRTGISACSNTKSQKNNKKNAMLVVIARLNALESAQTLEARSNDRVKQVGYICRGTRVRTYNFIENRVKDERIKRKFSTDKIMRGQLDLIYKEC